MKLICILTIVLIWLIIGFAIWFIGWLIVDKYGNFNSKISFILKWYDGWIGYFWDKKKRYLYIFLIPFFGIVIKPNRNDYHTHD